MKQSELLSLMDSFAQSCLHRMEYEAEGARLVLEKDTSAHFVQAVPFQRAVQPAVAPSDGRVHSLESESTAAAMVLPEQQPAAQTIAQEVKAPLVGVFYRAVAPEDAPFVKEGDIVEKGQVLCLIEAMKMMNELNSPVRGVVKRILVENEAVVSFGQVLFEVVPC